MFQSLSATSSSSFACASETLIAKTVLGERAAKVPMTSVKSMLGHTMGAASAIEAAACVLMLRNNVILPTINYTEPDPECDLDYVPYTARQAKICWEGISAPNKALAWPMLIVPSKILAFI